MDSYGWRRRWAVMGKLGREGGGCRNSLSSDLLGCDLTKAPRMGQSQSTPPSTQKVTEGKIEGDHQREGLRERKGEKVLPVPDKYFTGSPIH